MTQVLGSLVYICDANQPFFYHTSIQRPRKVGAKFTGEKLAPDEYYQPNLSFDYDGKRDRWNGYDLDNHQAVLEEYTKIEEVCVD